jgi:hypothetical protein
VQTPNCVVAAASGPHWCTALGVGQITFTLGWHTVAAVLPPH